MASLFKSLCFVTLLHAVSSDMQDDVVLDLVSSRLDHISIILSRIARKQKVLETRLNDKSADNNDCCKKPHTDQETDMDFTKAWLEDELAVIKRAISSEKEYVRNLEMKIEITAAAQTASNSFNSTVELSEKKEVDQTLSSALESRIESVKKNLDSVETMSSDLQNRVDSMEKNLDSVETVSSALQNKMDSVEKNLDSVEKMSSGIQDRVDSMEKKLGSVETASDGLESKMDSMESSISSLIIASGRKVSFSAQYRPEGGSAAIFKKERIIDFNHVFYNEGSGYNETTGIFTVPVSGVYQFIFFVEGWQKEDDFSCPTAVVALFVDGKAQTAAVAESRHVEQNTQAGNAYINYFSKGQIVVVGTAGTCDKYTIFAYRTTFSGVLLY